MTVHQSLSLILEYPERHTHVLRSPKHEISLHSPCHIRCTTICGTHFQQARDRHDMKDLERLDATLRSLTHRQPITFPSSFRPRSTSHDAAINANSTGPPFDGGFPDLSTRSLTKLLNPRAVRRRPPRADMKPKKNPKIGQFDSTPS